MDQKYLSAKYWEPIIVQSLSISLSEYTLLSSSTSSSEFIIPRYYSNRHLSLLSDSIFNLVDTNAYADVVATQLAKEYATHYFQIAETDRTRSSRIRRLSSWMVSRFERSINLISKEFIEEIFFWASYLDKDDPYWSGTYDIGRYYINPFTTEVYEATLRSLRLRGIYPC